jgi:hypothetical protein
VVRQFLPHTGRCDGTAGVQYHFILDVSGKMCRIQVGTIFQVIVMPLVHS